MRLPGWVSVTQAEALALRSSVALIPIAPHPDYLLNVTNKFYDALSKGLPVLSGISGALGQVIRENRVGIVYGQDGGPTLSEALEEMMAEPDSLGEMASNARSLYSDRFEFSRAYRDVVRRLEVLAGG